MSSVIVSSRFEILLEADFRLPSPGDRALNSAPDTSSGAEIAQHPFDRTVLMTKGYKEAADVLVARVLADQGGTTSDGRSSYLLVYPILFCYRHFLELSLKYVISKYGHLAGVLPNANDHDLNQLWQKFRQVLESFGDSDDTALTAVEDVVAEFAKIDPGSFTFRYPKSRRGDAIVINKESIDLANLCTTMNRVSNYFDGTDGYLDDLSTAGP